MSSSSWNFTFPSSVDNKEKELANRAAHIRGLMQPPRQLCLLLSSPSPPLLFPKVPFPHVAFFLNRAWDKFELVHVCYSEDPGWDLGGKPGAYMLCFAGVRPANATKSFTVLSANKILLPSI